MILKMKVPSPGESISEVEIAEWLVEDGDYVQKDQSIAEIDSDKATLELPAEESGIINIITPAGEIVAVGDVVCTIDTSIKKTVSIKNSKIQKAVETKKANIDSSESFSKKKATPLASAIIGSNDLLPKDVKGTGKAGKITKNDVLLALRGASNKESRGVSRRKLSVLRRKIATRLVAVKNETAMLTTFNEIDMTAIFNIRKEFKELFKQKYNVGLGFMSFFTKAVTVALNEFSDVNAIIDGDELVYHNYFDIGIAVSAPKGLMVPVLRNAELMSFSDIESEVKRLAIKAREGKLTISEMSGGTFTITNGGVFGSMLSTPIINPPQSAILGMHNIVERPMVVEGEIKIRPIMYVALSYDHRVIDGKESVGFLCRVKECVENPVLHLMEGRDVRKFLKL